MSIEELIDESFEGSCIRQLYHAYLGSTRSITLSVEGIFVKEIAAVRLYFNDSDSKESEDDAD